MPIYEYECESCGQVEEVFQKFSDDPLTTCKACNGKMHKLISQSSFHLKGTGWYVTDYSNKPNSSGNSVKKTEKTNDTSNESKTPAKATETTSKTDSKSK